MWPFPRSETRTDSGEVEANVSRSDFKNGQTGEGGPADPTEYSVPSVVAIDSEYWYENVGLLQNIVDAPAIDSVKEWFDLDVTIGDDLEGSQEQAQQLSRAIMVRLEELKFKERLKDLVRYSRIYPEGGLMYAATEEPFPEMGFEVAPVPPQIQKVRYINTLEPPEFTRHKTSARGTEEGYHQHKFMVGNKQLHHDRIQWVVRKYSRGRDMGISVPESLVSAIRAHNSATKTTIKAADEFFIKIFKRESKEGSPKETAEFLQRVRTTLSKLSVLFIGKNDEFTRPALNLAGLKELYGFTWENLAALSEIPQSRFKGNAQGAVTGADNDLIVYYDKVRSETQEGINRQAADWAIDLVLRETDTEVARLKPKDSKIDWNVNWRPLWQPSPKELAEIKKINAETNAIYIQSTVLSPDQVRSEEFKSLEGFSGV